MLDMTEYAEGLREGYRWARGKDLGQLRQFRDHLAICQLDGETPGNYSADWWRGYVDALGNRIYERLRGHAEG